MPYITIDAFPAALDRYGPRVRQAQMDGLLAAANKARNWIVATLIAGISPMPFDRGTFRQGWLARATATGASIYNPVPHARHIDGGVRPENVRPGKAMRVALAEWSIRKGITSTPKEARTFAFFAANKMKTTGIFQDSQFRITQRAVDEFLMKEVPVLVRKEIERIAIK